MFMDFQGLEARFQQEERVGDHGGQGTARGAQRQRREPLLRRVALATNTNELLERSVGAKAAADVAELQQIGRGEAALQSVEALAVKDAAHGLKNPRVGHRGALELALQLHPGLHHVDGVRQGDGKAGSRAGQDELGLLAAHGMRKSLPRPEIDLNHSKSSCFMHVQRIFSELLPFPGHVPSILDLRSMTVST